MAINQYVDNIAFYNALVEYRKQVELAKGAGKSVPKPSNYIGECIISIATKFSYVNNAKMSFINYTFRDEMVADAIENCIRALGSFDPEKSQNPFSYFTQVCYFAFIRRLQKEKRQGYIKYKILTNSPFDVFSIQEHDGDCDITNEFKNTYIEFMQAHQQYKSIDDKKLLALDESITTMDDIAKHLVSGGLLEFIDQL